MWDFDSGHVSETFFFFIFFFLEQNIHFLTLSEY